MDSFISFYPQFYENFEQLDEDTQEGFKGKGNEVLADKNVGNTICGGDDDAVREELSILEKPDLKSVMTFLIEE